MIAQRLCPCCPCCQRPMVGHPAAQKHCSRSCASRMRAKQMPKVLASDFDAIASQGFHAGGPMDAARLVLVDGKSQAQAAAITGRSAQAVYHAVVRFLRKYRSSGVAP